MSPRSIWLILGLISLGLPPGRSADGAVPVAPAPGEPVVDARLVAGRLANGVRYRILPHAVPPGRASLYLVVQAGAFHEQDDERGYAHFVEHMAFNGTRDFPGDSCVRTLQRLGLRFGPHLNGSTDTFETWYQINDLPVAKPEAIGTALRVLRNFADGLLFDEAEVRQERDVILSEARVRDRWASDAWPRDLEQVAPSDLVLRRDEMAAVFDGGRLAKRWPEGDEKTVAAATGARLRAFYDRWYRPSRMILAVVGDVAPGAVAAAVEEHFGALRPRGPEPVEPAIAPPWSSAAPAPRVHAVRHPQAPLQRVAAVSAAPGRPVDDAAHRRQGVVERVALAMLERRLDRQLQTSAPLEMFVSHAVPGWRIPIVRTEVALDYWNVAAVHIELELRRAIQSGFYPAELAAATAALRQEERVGLAEAVSRRSSALALALGLATARERVWTTPQADAAFFEAQLETVTAEECRRVLQELWPLERSQLVLSGPLRRWRAQDGETLELLTAARTQPLKKYELPAAGAPVAEVRFGPPGAVVTQRRDPETDAWLVGFSNGVHLNYKRTFHEPGTVRVNVRFGSGQLGTPAGRPGLVFAMSALAFGGIVDLSAEELREMRDRHQVALHFGFETDSYYFRAFGRREDLGFTLEFFSRYLTAPAFNPGAEGTTRTFIDNYLSRFRRNAGAVGDDAMRSYLYGGHPSVQRPDRDESLAYSTPVFRDWLLPELRESPLEVTIVGDLPLEEVVAVVARTLAATGPRRWEDPMADRRAFVLPMLPYRAEVSFEGSRKFGSVLLGWPGRADDTWAEDARLRVLAAVLQDRLRVRLREEMGETYSPRVEVWQNRTVRPALRVLRCRVEAAPKRLAVVAAAMREVAATLQREGATEDELERARGPLLQAAETLMTNNRWWLAVLMEAQSKPDLLAGVTEQVNRYGELTLAELNACARAVLDPARQCEFVVTPK